MDGLPLVIEADCNHFFSAYPMDPSVLYVADSVVVDDFILFDNRRIAHWKILR
jgi:hypothetical protein